MQQTTNRTAFRFSDLSPLFRKHGLWVIALTLTTMISVFIATQNGVNFGYDAGFYLSYAKSIQAGTGLSLRISAFSDTGVVRWIEAWPPLYPLILSLGADVFAWARLLDTITLAASVLLTYGLGYRLIRQTWAAGIAALVFLTIPTVLSEVFTIALSETVFTVLALLIVLLMSSYRFGEEPKSLRPALYAALLSMLALLTRYLGVPVTLALIVYSVLWALSVRSAQRWLPAIFFLLSLIPLGLWSLYLYIMTGNFTGVQQTNQPLKFSHIPESLRQMALQLLHGGVFVGDVLGIRSNWWIATIAGVLILLLMWLTWRQRAQVRRALSSLDALLVIYIVTYLVGFWALGARSHWIIADWRHYVPIYPAILILVFHLLAILSIRRAVIVAIAGLYCISGIAALPKTIQGSYWNTEFWRTDPVVNSLPDIIPPGTLVHGNEIGYLALHLGIDTAIRIFGGEAGFTEYQCSDLIYPPGFSRATFTLFDLPLLRRMTIDESRAFFTAWASPCGTVEKIVNDQNALIMIVHLNGR